MGRPGNCRSVDRKGPGRGISAFLSFVGLGYDIVILEACVCRELVENGNQERVGNYTKELVLANAGISSDTGDLKPGNFDRASA